MSVAAPVFGSLEKPHPKTMCFSVFADADPSILPKLCLPIAKRGLMISRLHAHVVHDKQEFHVDFQIDGLENTTAELIAQSMRQFPNVTCVLLSEKGKIDEQHGPDSNL